MDPDRGGSWTLAAAPGLATILTAKLYTPGRIIAIDLAEVHELAEQAARELDGLIESRRPSTSASG